MVVKGVIEPLAARMTAECRNPTVATKASEACDGQILVFEHMLGLSSRPPRLA
jgi:3-methyl-2-oxobutanoate hydroxymethyltransferase